MKKAAFPGRAWRLLRVALLWARRGGAFKRRIFVDLRLARGYLKGAAVGRLRRADRQLRLGERQFSIEDTPVFRFKAPSTSTRSLLRIPCITTSAAADEDDGDEFIFGKRETSSTSFGYLLDEEVEMGGGSGDDSAVASTEEEEEEDVGIDVKAEEFIAKFYEQMKIQRQMSWITYNEMLHRAAN